MISKTEIYKISDGKLDVFSSDFITKLKSSVLSHEITYEEQFRIDIIARHLYGDYSKYWILLEVNNIKDVSRLAAGQIIYYPSDISIIFGRKL